MKATKIFYQRCFNLGNYENEVIGVEVELEEGEKVKDVFENAKKCVEKMSKNKQDKEITPTQYAHAKNTIEKYEEQESDYLSF